ncbi:MAG: hypothetical protein ACKVVT_05010 [Dehalococcoidia bacterium]
MNPSQPFMLLRARLKPDAKPGFGAWFRTVHLQDVRRIPGISEAQGAVTPDGTRLGFYSFADGDAMQGALSSPEAAYARGTWEQWAAELEELGFEIWAPLGPLPMYHPPN